MVGGRTSFAARGVGQAWLAATGRMGSRWAALAFDPRWLLAAARGSVTGLAGPWRLTRGVSGRKMLEEALSMRMSAWLRKLVGGDGGVGAAWPAWAACSIDSFAGKLEKSRFR